MTSYVVWYRFGMFSFALHGKKLHVGFESIMTESSFLAKLQCL